jgi:SAM-dependent methyltransferase
MQGTITGRIRPHNERPAAVWSAGGSDYDQISRGIADSIEHAVMRLDPRPGERILDLATGTGWTSRVVARRGATVTGVDIAGEVLAVAKARARAEGLPIEYQVGDAEDLPFEDGAFDAVVSTCGIMFATRPEAAAAELARVCRKGGRIALTTWLSDSSVFGMFKVMRRYMPPPPTAAPPSPFEWGGWHASAAARGAFKLRFEPGVSLPRAERRRSMEHLLRGYGPTKSLAASLDPTRRDALRADFIAFHNGFSTELGICVPREYWVTVGVRV